MIDGNVDNIHYIKKDRIYWKYNLKAICAFVNRDNINNLLIENGISGDIGLFSIDIDGNDYWVWEAITCISPRIIVCEYNHIFGPIANVTIPYDPNFIRTKAHFSNLYFGASIGALDKLSKKKGYALVGSNSNSHNAFFVRNDIVRDLKIKRPEESYVLAQFKESRDVNGSLTFLNFNERVEKISEMFVYDLDSERNVQIKELPSLK